MKIERDTTSTSLGALLREEGLLTEEALEAALAGQHAEKVRLGEYLVQHGIVEEGDLIRILARQLKIPVFRLSEHGELDSRVALLIPETFAKNHNLLAIARTEEEIVVAMADPLDLEARDFIRQLARLTVRPVIGKSSEIQKAIAGLYRESRAAEQIRKSMADVEGQLSTLDVAEDLISDADILHASEDAAVIRLVQQIVANALAERATDIHIEALEQGSVVRFRVDGALHDYEFPSKRMHAPLIVRIKVLSNIDIADRRKPHDGRFTVRQDNKEVDVRVSTLPTVFGEKVVLRLLDKTASALKLPQLGFEPDMLRAFRDAIKAPYGMILVSGPTGSGKSTTLYSALSEILSPDRNITTIEDPVEYMIPRINQVQMDEKAGLTFATALRAILRQDPDVIMVGEIRDAETAEMAIRSAMTGHLVFSTVHANDAPSTATRIVDMDIQPFLVASALNLVIAQRLVRRNCEFCIVSYTPTEEQLGAIQMAQDRRPGATFKKGKGCTMCRGRGFLGRVAIYELLKMDQFVRQLIMDKRPAREIAERAIESGMITLRESGIRKVEQGVTTPEEVLKVVFSEDV